MYSLAINVILISGGAIAPQCWGDVQYSQSLPIFSEKMGKVKSNT